MKKLYNEYYFNYINRLCIMSYKMDSRYISHCCYLNMLMNVKYSDFFSVKLYNIRTDCYCSCRKKARHYSNPMQISIGKCNSNVDACSKSVVRATLNLIGHLQPHRKTFIDRPVTNDDERVARDCSKNVVKVYHKSIYEWNLYIHSFYVYR